MSADQKLRRMVTSAIFAAAITVTTTYILHIPAPTIGGYFHIGDALIYLCACLLPLPYAIAAGAVGGALADLLTAPMWALPTFLIKAVICLPFTRRQDRLLCPRNVAAPVLSGLVSSTLYGLTGVLFSQSWAAFLPQFSLTLAQGVASGILYVILAGAMDKAGVKKWLT